MQNFAADLFAMTNDTEDDMGNIENALFTLKSSFSGASAPSSEAGQLWYDTTGSLLRHRGATSNWRGVIAGSAAFKIWVYANATEEGFDEDATCADCVIGLKGGAQAYGTWGKQGTWDVGGLTADVHLHPAGTLLGPSHTHPLAHITTGISTEGSGSDVITEDAVSDAGGTQAVTGSTANTAAPSGVSSDEGWRPQAAVGIMVYPVAVV